MLVATAYDCPSLGATYALIINEAHYFGDSLSFSLLSPVQLRDNDAHVDERHRQHAHESIFGIHVPSEPLQIPFTLDGVIAGFDTRPPTQDERDDTTLHIELTSNIEWLPHTFADSLAEEENPIMDDVDEEKIINLRARRLKVLDSKAARLKIKSCMQTSSATQFPFKIQLANEVSALSMKDPILRRIAALTTIKANSEETNWRCDFRRDSRKRCDAMDGWIRDH